MCTQHTAVQYTKFSSNSMLHFYYIVEVSGYSIKKICKKKPSWFFSPTELMAHELWGPRALTGHLLKCERVSKIFENLIVIPLE